MIKIGINENIYIKHVEQEEKGAINVTFAEAGVAKFNPFEALQQEEVIEGSNETTIKIFPPLPPKEDNEKLNTEEKRTKAIERDLNKVRGILVHLLKGYTTKEVYGRLGKEMFSGIDINADNYFTKIQQKEILEAVHNNLARIFVEIMKEFVDKEDLKFRLLLIRQNKDKHYAGFRNQYLEDNPFWESMDVPKEGSKLKFTNHEIKEGLDDSSVATRTESADKKPAAAPQSAANIFGQQ